MKAVVLSPAILLNSPLKKWLDDKCAARGVNLEWHDLTDEKTNFVKAFQSCRNVIAWNCRMTHDWLSRGQQNVLHVENSLLSQKSGMFTDHRGFFSQSNLCRKATWKTNYPHANPEFFARREFKWSAFAGGNPDGPILVALQCREDCNLKLEFPAGEAAPDKVVRTLEIVRDYLPTGRKVLIRPHPRERANFTHGGVWQDHWQLDTEDTLAVRLPQCCALVTVNSTCASEAALLGLPTATLGTGAFTDSGVMLECAHNLSLLSGILTFTPDIDRCRSYVQAILGRHLLPYDLTRDRPCQELEDWLSACQMEKNTVDSILSRVKACPHERKNRPHIWHDYLACIDDGLCLEFGVFKGYSINYMAKARPCAAFHGFDSFEGLPEEWMPSRPAGYFSLGASPPKVHSNVTLHQGWFDQTLPPVLSALFPSGKLQGVHIDCDLGSSTQTVLKELTQWLLRDKPALLFDELVNYPGFREHEIKAFSEWATEHDVEFEVLSKAGQQVLVRLV